MTETLAATELPVVWRSLADLRPHPQNYRAHPPAQIAHIAASLREHGFYRPIVTARDDTILAGHGLALAAASLDLDPVPTLPLDLTPYDPRALRVLTGDNELLRFAESDPTALVALLSAIDDDAAGLLGTGFDDAALAALIALHDTSPVVPEPGDPPNPALRAECLVEILCSRGDLADFEVTLAAWGARRGVEINIS